VNCLTVAAAIRIMLCCLRYCLPVDHVRPIGCRRLQRDVPEAASPLAWKYATYATMKLDTLPSMRAAIRLYEALGFVRCAAFYPTPLANTVFMELQL
jgi:hypothetical protein